MPAALLQVVRASLALRVRRVVSLEEAGNDKIRQTSRLRARWTVSKKKAGQEMQRRTYRLHAAPPPGTRLVCTGCTAASIRAISGPREVLTELGKGFSIVLRIPK